MSNENTKGKVIIITGASSGIGEAAARLLAKQGAKVALAARRRDRLDETVRQIQAEGGEAAAFTTDVTDRASVDAMVDQVVERFGRVDVLVNNAGLMPLSPLAKLKVDEWDRMVDVNIKGVLYGIGAVLPRMLEQKAGHVINVSSVAGIKVFPAAAVYCGTKYAVRAISEGLRQEAKPHVRVTIICPGAVETELLNTISDKDTVDGLKAALEDFLPADSIARAIAYAVGEPANVDVNEIVVRPTAQTL